MSTTNLSQLKELLERVARACAHKATFHEVTPMAPRIYGEAVERNVRYFMAEFDRDLLPLLEAGQAMHDEAQGDYQTFGAAYKAWDAALSAAAGEKP